MQYWNATDFLFYAGTAAVSYVLGYSWARWVRPWINR